MEKYVSEAKEAKKEMLSPVLSISEKWRFMALPYFIEAHYGPPDGKNDIGTDYAMRGLDIDYVEDKEAWAGFSIAVSARIAYNDFVITWDGFEFELV